MKFATPFICLFGLLASSCGKDDSRIDSQLFSDSVNQIEGKEHYVECSISPDQGDSAYWIGDAEYRPALLGHSYNVTILNSVANASANETIRFMREEANVNVMIPKVQIVPGAARCNGHNGRGFVRDVAPDADEFAQLLWDSVDQGQGALYGLYLAEEYTEGRGPVLLLNPYAARWVHVHELMHHAFKLGREKRGAPGRKEVYQDALHSTRYAKGARPFASCEDQAKMLVDAYQKQFTFDLDQAGEEVAVEYAMLDYDSSGEFSNMTGRGVSPFAYLDFNFEEIEQRLNKRKESFLEVQTYNFGFCDYEEVRSEIVRQNTLLDAAREKITQLKEFYSSRYGLPEDSTQEGPGMVHLHYDQYVQRLSIPWASRPLGFFESGH